MRTRFILIQTSHAGNVGAAARALKTMGFDDMVLVAPRWPNVLRREETIQRASGALDVLRNCRVVDTLDEALEGMTHLCATAMTPRDFGPPTRSPREHFELLLKSERLQQYPSALVADGVSESSAPEGMAFLFGSERHGMRNEDVYRCHACLSIPTNPQFGSLNIASAIQVIAYEWRLALGGYGVEQATKPPVQADAQQVAGMLQHWEEALLAIDFLDPAAPKKLMPRLNSMFNRAQLTQEEIHILRGIAKAMLQKSLPAKG
ncbi:RNA methyltransferase [Curvibacter sp. CHRR-16]|uniref:RNA methyltransferase n=1 Tax=Curvibacter sp. CHRR-16 TaxID=2835872 RepID=UPI001BDB179E|nr:RNA methyltransferase [Curvibacter sp. CHRR-16]MBT0571504.1 RNA methyltransferase [Curvibacter sp. CHRR-16]